MRRLLGLLPLLLLLVSCAAGIKLPSSPPSISGQIQEVRGARILVNGGLAPGAANPRLVWVTVTRKTKIATMEQKGAIPLTTDALTVGTLVEVWFDGGVRESYPEQADGAFILVKGKV